MAFCVITLIGLFSIGVNTSKESAEELQATHIAQSLLATRRATPTTDLTATGFPLPVINASTSSPAPILLDYHGNPTSVAARYQLTYRIDVPEDSTVAPVFIWLRLTWPANGQPLGACELATHLPRP